MIQPEFTQESIARLKYERYHHPHPRVQRKMNAVYLKSQGLKHKEIERLEGICGTTLRGYLREYQDGGVDRLKEVNFYCPKSKLEDHAKSIEEYFTKNPPASLNEAAAKIEDFTGLKRKRESVRVFLINNGFKPRKIGMIPTKVDVEKQEKFLNEELQPRIAQAQAGERRLFFVDSAHFVHAPFLGVLWTIVRLFIKAPSGRNRFNVLSAMDAITHSFIMITNTSYINASSVCELPLNIVECSSGVPITVLLDNLC